MTDLLDNTPAAREWVAQALQRLRSIKAYGNLAPAVIWTDARDERGELLIPSDPSLLVKSINNEAYLLTEGHDPGKPQGQVLESETFISDEGIAFVAAIIGYYAGGEVLSFSGLGLDVHSSVASPDRLPSLPTEIPIQFGVDPREVDPQWVDSVLKDAPIRIERVELSHNAAIADIELIRIALPHILLVWNPFVTAISSEAGKATFAASNKWIRNLLGRLAERRNPILDVQSYHSGCGISFLFRGTDVAHHYAGHESLNLAAVQASQLVNNLKNRGLAAKSLVYEFDKIHSRWFPTHAILCDGRIINNHGTLIAIEQLPKQLSLGISRGKTPSTIKAATNKNSEI